MSKIFLQPVLNKAIFGLLNPNETNLNAADFHLLKEEHGVRGHLTKACYVNFLHIHAGSVT